MKKLLLTIPLGFIACTTDSNNVEGMIDLSELGNQTIINQEVVDGETRSFKVQVNYKVVEWHPNAGYVTLETPGSECIIGFDDDGWEEGYSWVSNPEKVAFFEHEDTWLEWNGLDYTGGPDLFSKWTWGGSEELMSLTLSENKVVEEIEYEIECFNEERPVGDNAEKVGCSTIEIKDLPKKLTVRNYHDTQMGLHEVWTYGDESCERYLPFLNTEKSCNLMNRLENEEDSCEELLEKLAQIKGTEYVSICREDYRNDGYCDEECLNYNDPDCE